METLHGSNTSSAPSFEKTEQELLTHLPPPPSMVDRMEAMELHADSTHTNKDHQDLATLSPTSNPLLSFIFNTAASLASGLGGVDANDDDDDKGVDEHSPKETVQSSPPAVAAFPAMTILPYAQPKTSFPVSVPEISSAKSSASPDSIVVNGSISSSRSRPTSMESTSLGSFIWDFFRTGDTPLPSTARSPISATSANAFRGPSSSPNHHTSSTQSQAPPDEFLVGGHYRGGCDTADIFSDHIELDGPLPAFSETGMAAHVDVKIRGRNEAGEAVAILSFDIIKELHAYLPPLLREASSIDLLYSIEQHGISLNTLYRLCEEGGPCLIALRDTNSNVFGAFSNESLGPRSGFFGNGTCFLWKQHAESGEVSVYPATGLNEYLVLNELHCIAFGGGEGHFGLWIDDELFNGHSGRCETFGNEKLSSSSNFQIVALEIWGFKI